MRILALQLKRIGDLVLTTPALAALKDAGVHLTLGVHESTTSLLPAIPHLDSAIVFRRGWTPWQQVLTGRFDAVLDFTGTDRSTLAAFVSRAPRRITFEWARRNRLRALAYNEFVSSNVRERHTVDHYADLVAPITEGRAATRPILSPPENHARAAARPSAYAVLHPGTARAEKNWLPERWAEVAQRLAERHGLEIVITSGPVASERAQAAQIQSEIGNRKSEIIQPPDLCSFAALLRDATLVVSCDTAAVHLGAAFQRPQVALFGPTNPFHWRPRHERAVVISAAQPDAPMTAFDPRMKGAPMERISTAVVCRAIDALLAK